LCGSGVVRIFMNPERIDTLRVQPGEPRPYRACLRQTESNGPAALLRVRNMGKPPAFSLQIRVNDQVQLTEILPYDKPAFVEHLNDREIYANTLSIPYPYCEADADFFLGMVAQTTAEFGQPILFAIREQSGRLIGGSGFKDLSIGHSAEIGYWLAKSYRGQGAMTQVVRAMCEYGVEQWGLVRIVANVVVHNTASTRVLEKCGFELEGTRRKQYRKDDQFIDVKLYARLT